MGGQKIRNISIMQSFGGQLRSLRNQKGMTQEELGYKAGISTSQIARIEAGILNTTISTVICISRAMDLEPGVLFETLKLTRREDYDEQMGPAA
jgi:transcriptional regulator with XRE-family HTH domain